MSELEDAGIIKHWTEEVIARRIRENRETADPFIYNSATDFSKVNIRVIEQLLSVLRKKKKKTFM